MNLDQKLSCKDPKTGEQICFESGSRHAILDYIAREYFKSPCTDNWILINGSKLALLSGREVIGTLDDATWEDRY